MTTKANTGIRSFGAYIPSLRMARTSIAQAHAWALPNLRGLAKGEKSICCWDEDAITMSVEAGRDCLIGHNAISLSALTVASTSAPYADLQNAMIVASALRSPTDISVSDQGASTRAGLSAVSFACKAQAKQHLIIAAENRHTKPGSPQEMLYGAGAGALLIDSGDDLLAHYLGSESLTVPFIDHFRSADARYDYQWEERWIRDEGISKLVPQAINALLKKIGKTSSDVAHFSLTGGAPRTDVLVAKLSGINSEAVLPDLRGNVGDTGTSHPILQLLAALERAQPGDLIVVGSFAQGAEFIAFEMQQTPAPSKRRGLAGSIARRTEETAYLKMLSFSGELEIDWGMRAEFVKKTSLTQQYRVADQVLGFVGGKCTKCDQVQFPRLPNCVNCGATDSQTPLPLADQAAEVATYTADWLMYSPAPPLYVGLVQFNNGARLLMEINDVGPEGIDVGSPLEMSFRIKERDTRRQYDRYFWKARPTR